MIEPWPAPSADAPVDAVVRVPGSKSMTNRALVLAALADTPSILIGALRARDTELMAAALSAFGCAITIGTDSFEVAPRTPLQGPAHVDCGLAGTVMRFLPPMATLVQGPVYFDGDQRARERPLAPLIRALRSLGAEIDGDGLPLVVHGRGGLSGGSATVDAAASSQLVSGLLLSAPRFEGGLTLTHQGMPLPSLPHVDMTVAMLRERGAIISADTHDPQNCQWRVEPTPLHGGRFVIEPDLSNAGPFLAAAMVTGGQVHIPDWPTKTDQAGDSFRQIFATMGARVDLAADGLHLTGPHTIQGMTADMSQVGELVPTVAAVAAFAESPTTLVGVAHLRGHETDRISALATELRRLGSTVVEHADGLTVEPSALRPALLDTYDDHRMATFAAIVGLRLPGTEVADITATTKTLPDFPHQWQSMLMSA